mmetsp:Transcript_4973/g.21122  ORF Transcript_4973/g.21122 Transcript_4973/m.21122 type:complete len:332 (+) Transcript_4973:914-1909(+)
MTDPIRKAFRTTRKHTKPKKSHPGAISASDARAFSARTSPSPKRARDVPIRATRRRSSRILRGGSCSIRATRAARAWTPPSAFAGLRAVRVVLLLRRSTCSSGWIPTRAWTSTRGRSRLSPRSRARTGRPLRALRTSTRRRIQDAPDSAREKKKKKRTPRIRRENPKGSPRRSGRCCPLRARPSRRGRRPTPRTTGPGPARATTTPTTTRSSTPSLTSFPPCPVSSRASRATKRPAREKRRRKTPPSRSPRRRSRSARAGPTRMTRRTRTTTIASSRRFAAFAPRSRRVATAASPSTQRSSRWMCARKQAWAPRRSRTEPRRRSRRFLFRL